MYIYSHSVSLHACICSQEQAVAAQNSQTDRIPSPLQKEGNNKEFDCYFLWVLVLKPSAGPLAWYLQMTAATEVTKHVRWAAIDTSMYTPV